MFDRAADREGAYDFLESDHVEAEAVAASVFAGTAARARGSDYAFVAIDGSSLLLTDDRETKGFGPVNENRAGHGLKVVTAFAVARDGVPLGLIDQIYWSRPPTEDLTKAERRERNRQRAFEDKETAHFVAAAQEASTRLEEVGVRAWVVIDREGDNRDILLRLHAIGCLFTVRAQWDRRLFPHGEVSLREELDAQPVLGTYAVDIGRTGRRAGRRAVLEVRAAQVTLHFAKTSTLEREALRLYAVLVREVGSTADQFEWLLYTNVPVFSSEHAQQIVASYRTRWRIEEFHRTWKRGDCNVEDAQLRSVDAMIKWAIILAAVAGRIERLKYLSRHAPDSPASSALAIEEIEALKLDRRRRTRSRRKLPEMPTVAEATAWVAELGGWIGPRNGPPGSTTLARGLERLSYLVEGIAIARRAASAGRRT